jgi:ATP-binding cassette subfamily B protein
MLAILAGIALVWAILYVDQRRAQTARSTQPTTDPVTAFRQWGPAYFAKHAPTEAADFWQWFEALPAAQAQSFTQALEAFCRHHQAQLSDVWRAEAMTEWQRLLSQAVLAYALAIWVARARPPLRPIVTAPRSLAQIIVGELQPSTASTLQHFIETAEAPSLMARAPAPDTAPITVIETLRRAVAQYWRPHLSLAVFVGGLVAVHQLYLTTFFASLKFIIDSALVSYGLPLLTNTLAVLAAGMVGVALLNLAQEFFKARAAALILNDTRRHMFTQLHRLSAGFYSRAQVGNVLARFTSDLAEIKQGVVDGAVELAEHGFGFVFGLGALIMLDWRLTLVLGATVGLGSWVVNRFFAPAAYTAAYRLKRGEGQIASIVQENVRGQAIIRAFDLSPLMQARFNRLLNAFVTPQTNALFFSQFVGLMGTEALLLAQVLTLSAGLLLLAQGQLTAGTLVAFALLLLSATRNLQTIARYVVPSLIAAGGGLRRIEELMRELPSVSVVEDAPALPRLANHIRLEQVSFTYPGQTTPAVRDLTCALPAGQHLAIVGPSGAGKTTLLGLLTRVYDPTAGQILFDDHDLRGVAPESLYAQTGVVLQDNYLFDLTIRENLRLANPAAAEAEIEAAARDAEIHDSILLLPRGYDTPIGEAGAWLSMGQRQRLAITRALLRHPALLILDEATANLDSQTETAVLNTLDRVAVGRTVIIVTHRLAAAQRADTIFVMDQGRLVERGSHAELLAHNGLYARLWQAQVLALPEGAGESR